MKEFKENFENLDISPEDIGAVLNTLKEKDLSWPYGITQKFEKEIAKFLKVKYVLAHCNGTSAMYAAMFSIGVGPGTEVICPSYTWWASAAPAVNLGAKVVFCEINSNNLTIDSEDVKRKITRKTKAIIIPHLWGMFGDIETIKEITQKIGRKIYLIEDASHALGAKYKNHSLGTLGDVGIFSLQMGKPLPAGEGGLLVTNNYNLYEKAVFIGHYERIKDLKNDNIRKYKKTGGGYKFRIHPLGAALAFSQLKRLERKLKKQNLLMDYFEKRLKTLPEVQVFNKNPKEFVVGGRFGFRVGLKDKLIDAQSVNLLKNEVFAENEYVPLLHMEPFFIEKGAKYSKNGSLPLTEKLYQTLLGLPVFYHGEKSDVDSYVEKLKKLLIKME
jgi:perosamine synthetase